MHNTIYCSDVIFNFIVQRLSSYFHLLQHVKLGKSGACSLGKFLKIHVLK